MNINSLVLSFLYSPTLTSIHDYWKTIALTRWTFAGIWFQVVSIDHLIMSMCRVIFCVVGRGSLLWPVCPLGKTLLAFALIHFVFQGQTYLLLQISPNLLFLYSNLLWWNGQFFLVLILEGLIGLHRTIQLQFLWHWRSGHSLGLLWYWRVCPGNKPRSFCHFWDSTQVLKHCISDSYVDYEGYSISSKGLLSSVVDTMVIWIKFACSHPF